MVIAAECQDPGILQISQVPGRFRLRKFKDFFQIGNAHFLVFKDQMQYPEARFIGAGFENLRAKRQIETF